MHLGKQYDARLHERLDQVRRRQGMASSALDLQAHSMGASVDMGPINSPLAVLSAREGEEKPVLSGRGESQLSLSGSGSVVATAVRGGLKRFFELQLNSLKATSGAEVERQAAMIKELKGENMALFLREQNAQLLMYRLLSENVTMKDKINLLNMQVSNLEEDAQEKQHKSKFTIVRQAGSLTEISDLRKHF